MSLLLATLLLLAPPGEDFSDIEGLLDTSVVSTASRANESETLAPAVTSVITADDLRRFGMRSLDQALVFLGLGITYERPSGVGDVGARGVVISGDYGSHMLLLIDGHAVNEAWAGAAYFDEGVGLPLELVDHVEVILGPGSVLYGSAAMQGVINVVTKRAKDYEGAHAVLESEVPISGRGGVGYGQRFNLLGQEGEAVLGAQYMQLQGPRYRIPEQDSGPDLVTGDPVQWHVDGPADNLWGGPAGKGIYIRNPGAYARLRWGQVEVDLRGTEIARGVPFTTYANYADPKSLERDRWFAADLRYHVSPVDRLEIAARAYGDIYSYREQLPSHAAQACLDDMDSGCLWTLDGHGNRAGLELQGRYDWLNDGRFVTLAGADGQLRRVGSTDLYEPYNGTADVTATDYHAGEQATALFAQQTARFGDLLAANLGARFDRDQRFGSHLSPRAALVLTPWEGGALKALYAEAFRAPSAYETYYGDQTYQVPPQTIHPEVVRSVEGVIEQRFGGQRLQIGVFDARWRDLIELHDMSAAEIAAAQERGDLDNAVSSAVQFQNVAGLRNTGLTAAYSGTLLDRRLGLGLNATWARTRRGGAAKDEPIPLSPTYFGNARVSYAPDAPLPVVALAVAHVGKRVVEGIGSGFDPETRAPAQTELRLTLSGLVPWHTPLGYRLSVDYALARHVAYGIGPLDGPTGTYTRQQLMPYDRFRVLAGVSYDLGP